MNQKPSGRVRMDKKDPFAAVGSEVFPQIQDRPEGVTDLDRRNNAAFARVWPMIVEHRLEDALAFLRSLAPGDAEPHWIDYHIGKVYHYMERYGKALKHLRRAGAADPQRPEVYHAIGAAFHAQQRLREAAEQYDKAIDLKPDYVEAWQSLGLALLQAGESLNAAGAFRTAAIELACHAMRDTGTPVPPRPEGSMEAIDLTPEAAARLIAGRRYAAIVFHAGLALVTADEHEGAKGAFEEALAMGLEGVEAENAQKWLAKYDAGNVSRRLN